MHPIRKMAALQRTAFCLGFALTLTTAGCAVLTRSQVAEIRKFSTATQNYGTLPGTVITAYSDFRLTTVGLEQATKDYSKDGNALAATAWRSVTNSVALSVALKAQADRADRAMKILDTYSELLVTLSSDQFTDDLAKRTESLGKALDGGVKEYNKIYRAEIASFGSTAAAIVRGAGGIWIRHKQTIALKDSIPRADPMVKTLTADVEKLLQFFLTAPDGDGEGLKTELGRLELLFENEARESGRHLQPATIWQVQKTVSGIRNAEELARLAIRSARKYRQAHAKLAEAVTKAQDLKGQIEEIETLVAEIKAAQALKKQLDKQ